MIRAKGASKLLQSGQADQEVAVVIQLHDEQPPAAPLFEREMIDSDGTARTGEDFGRIIAGAKRRHREIGRGCGL